MISGVIGGKALPKAIADQIIDRTDGIPLFPRQQLDAALEQLVRAELIFRRGTPPEAECRIQHVASQSATAYPLADI
jgi:hypothetical protein